MGDRDEIRASVAEAPVHRLNLNMLYPLDAILHASTLTEAGRRVRLSQSAMSHALRRLREHFGDDLVTHAGGEQHLTALGLALRGEVRRVLLDVDGTFNFALSFDPLTSTDTITVAATESFEQMVLGPVLRNLSAAAPGVRVDMMALDAKEPRRAIEQGADLLLLPSEAAIPGLNTLPIMRDQAACMIWDRHPELGECNDITEEQYRAARHIVAQGEMTDTFPTDEAGADMLRARRIHVRTTSQATLPTIVIGSDLVATGSAWLFQQYACVMPLKVVTAPFARNWNTVLAQWPRHRQTPMVNWFVDQIRASHGHPNAGK